jgi:DNA-binding NarL/FixJ family response regulator
VKTTFVGRESELAVLVGLLDDAVRSGSSVAALVTGQPGSGKTRLLDQVLSDYKGRRVVRSAGYEPSKSIPLAAAGHLLRTLAEAPNNGTRLEELAFTGNQPDVYDLLRVFEVAHRSYAEVGPLVLAVDDLQWVDEQTLALIHYMLIAAASSSSPMIVIAAGRPSSAVHAFRAGAEAALTDQRSVALELRSLPLTEGIALVRAIDGELGAAAATEMWRRSQGSPFWLEVLAKGGASDSSTVINDRLRSASGDAGVLLSALAMVGRPSTDEEMSAVLDWPPPRVHHAAGELVAIGLIIGDVGALRIVHDLIREEVVRTIPAPTRHRLHASMASVVEGEAGDDLSMLCEALDHRRSAELSCTDLALRILSSPRRRLIGNDGLRLLSSIGVGLDPDDADRLPLYRGLAELAMVLGEHALALESWSLVGGSSPDASLKQHAEIEAARAASRLGRSEDAHTHLDRVRHMRRRSAVTSVQLDAVNAQVLLWLDHRTAAGADVARRALRSAERMVEASGGVPTLSTGQRMAYLEALEAASDAALQQDRVADAARWSDEALEIARGLDDETYVSAMLGSAFIHGILGQVHEAIELYARAWDTADRLVLPVARAESGQGLAGVLFDLGRLREARSIAVEAAEMAARAKYDARRYGYGWVYSIDLSIGDTRKALEGLRQAARGEDDPHFRLGIHQAIAEWQGRFGPASAAGDVEAEVAAAKEDARLAGCPRCSAELSVVSAELLARVGRIREAKDEFADWESRAIGTSPMHEVWRSRARSAIAMAEGHNDQATDILARLVVELESRDLIHDLLVARIDLGRASAALDRDRAVRELTSAAMLAEEIGAKTEERVAARELRRLGVRTWRRGTASSGEGMDLLSEREREIADMVAQGNSNQEVAEALFLSPKTVERHVTNILAKLGLRNRTEVAALMRETEGTGSPR